MSGINDESTLHLVLRLRGGPSPDVQPLDLSRSGYEKQFEQQSMITQHFSAKPVTPACPPMPAVGQFTMTSQQSMSLTGQMFRPARPDPVPLYGQTLGVSSFGAKPVQAQMQQETLQGGMFGAPPQGVSSLFGAQPVQAQMQQELSQGGLFGAPPQGVSSFFGAQPVQTQMQQEVSQGGLFGAPPQGVSSFFGAQPVQTQMQQEVSQGGLFGVQSESMPSLFRGQPVQAHMSKVNEPIGGGGFSFGSKAPNAIDAFSFSEPIGGGGFSFGSPASHNISFGMQSNSDLGVSGMCMGGTYQDRFHKMSSLRGLGVGGGPVVSNIYIH